MLWHIFLVYSFIIYGVYSEEKNEFPTVEISTGLLQGQHQLSYGGKTYSAFEGIPYARPPIGELRFEAPKKPYNWTGTWIATTQHHCITFQKLRMNQPESEDCLYVNVFVPREAPSSEDNLDVVVHIHGGAFMLGSPHELMGPKYLMDKEVIYVSLTYRLGPLGFLSTEDEVIPGNNGLKDQNFALKWVQDNIKYFGGNPDSVTITGLSAGGASVHYHMISPLSKGLFNAAYSASGTALDPWTLQEQPLTKAKRLAVQLGCKPTSSKEILNCLMSRSSTAIYEAALSFQVKEMPFSPFGPVIENSHDGAFITRHPYSLLLDGHVFDVPWLVAVTKDEGLYPASYFYNDIEEIEQTWDSFAPLLLDFNYTVAENEKLDVSKLIREHYFGDKQINKDTFPQLVKACSDRHFYIGFETAIKLQRKVTNSPIYPFMFAYRGRNSFATFFNAPETEKGVSHGDDTLYYLSNRVFDAKLTEEDEKVKDVMVDIITSFAKDKVPKVDGYDWKPYTGGKLNYFYFGSFGNFETREVEDLGTNKFWSTLPIDDRGNVKFVKDEL